MRAVGWIGKAPQKIICQFIVLSRYIGFTRIKETHAVD